MRRILVVGAGGHGQTTASIIQQAATAGANLEVVGFVDDDLTLTGKVLLGVPVLGGRADIDRFPHDAVTIGVGDNRARHRLFSWARQRGEAFVNAIHPMASIAPGVSLGTGLSVQAGSIIATLASIGDNVVLSANAVVGHHCTVGAHSHIGAGAVLAGGAAVGEGAMIGLLTGVVPNATIGEWAVVGICSTVTGDIPARCAAWGSPARVVKRNGAREED